DQEDQVRHSAAKLPDGNAPPIRNQTPRRHVFPQLSGREQKTFGTHGALQNRTPRDREERGPDPEAAGRSREADLQTDDGFPKRVESVEQTVTGAATGTVNLTFARPALPRGILEHIDEAEVTVGREKIFEQVAAATRAALEAPAEPGWASQLTSGT
ncbi:MAG: hypothetical protein DMG23_00630, partial [Acidobacteria bacterium]